MIFAHYFNFTFLRYVVLDTDGGWFPFSSTRTPLPIAPVALSLTHQKHQFPAPKNPSKPYPEAIFHPFANLCFTKMFHAAMFYKYIPYYIKPRFYTQHRSVPKTSINTLVKYASKTSSDAIISIQICPEMLLQ